MKSKILFSSIGAVILSLYYWFWGQAKLYADLQIPLFSPENKGKTVLLFIFAIFFLTLIWIANDADNDNTQLSADKLKAQAIAIPSRFKTNELEGFIIGKQGKKYIRLPIETDPRHGLIFGRPGAGKTVMIISWIIWILNYISQHRPLALLVSDIKPELSKKSVYEGLPNVAVINLAVFGRYCFNIFFGLTQTSSDDRLILRLDIIVRAMIIDPPDSETPYFTDNARNILIGVFGWGYRKSMKFSQIIDKFLHTPTLDLIAEILSDEEFYTNHPKLTAYLIPFNLDQSNEAFQSVVTTIMQTIHIFDFDTVKACFDCEDATHTVSPEDLIKGTSIFIQCLDSMKDKFMPAIRLIFSLCFNYILGLNDAKEDNRGKIVALIDEAATVKVPDIQHYMDTGRSKGLEIFQIYQNFSQIITAYGQSRAKGIMENAGTVIVQSCKDPDTAKMLSDWIGHYRETKYSTSKRSSTDTSTSESSEYRLIYDISDITKLESQGKMLVFHEGTYFPVQKIGYYQIPDFLEISKEAMEKNKEIYDNLKEL